MSQGRGLRGALAVLMSGMLLLLAVGCNQEQDFDPDELFSIEDYAQDQDYAVNYVRMMNSWRNSTREAKGYLETNVDGLTFVESVPPEWTQIDPSLRTYPWSVLFIQDPNNPNNLLPADDEDQWLKERWYFSSFQDASYSFISVDHNVPEVEGVYEPAKVEYMRLSFLASPLGGTFGVGDSVSVQYSDDYLNPSKVTGSGMFWNSDVVQAQSAPSDIASFASMSNFWGGDFSNMSSNPENPQGEFDINGFTQLVRADLVEQATLDVVIEASIRSNARGDAIIWVEGEKRAEVIFEYYDTSFHGYYLLRESDFREPNRF